MSIVFHGLPTDQIKAARARRRDAYGNPFTTAVSPGSGTPCRHCLRIVPEGAPYLIGAWRPFPEATAYAETGPIFLCADDCAAAQPAAAMPRMLQNPSYTLRPYDNSPKIRYGLEQIAAPGEIARIAEAMLSDPETAFVDIRNPKTGCFQCRIHRTVSSVPPLT